jgi:branched-chain amino acid transport system permease protein
MVTAILSLVVIYLLVNSTFGKGITAIREDEIAAELMGVNTRRVKLVAFMVSSFIAGVAGGLLAHYLASINPTSFDIKRSTESLVMVYLGGMGSISGSVIAAIVFTLLVEALSPLKILKWVVIPLILILLMLYRPQGLFGNREIKFNLLGGKQAERSIETITEAGDAAAGD